MYLEQKIRQNDQYRPQSFPHAKNLGLISSIAKLKMLIVLLQYHLPLFVGGSVGLCCGMHCLCPF